jgi:hypothetical protein
VEVDAGVHAGLIGPIVSFCAGARRRRLIRLNPGGTLGGYPRSSITRIVAMNVETVEVRPQPMLYLTRRAAMADIGRIMGEMFEAMGRFVGERHVPRAGPPRGI